MEHVRVPPSGLLYELAYFRGWLAYLVVIGCPLSWFGRLPRKVCGWAGFYAYDDRHLPKDSAHVE